MLQPRDVGPAAVETDEERPGASHLPIGDHLFRCAGVAPESPEGLADRTQRRRDASPRQVSVAGTRHGIVEAPLPDQIDEHPAAEVNTGIPSTTG